MSACFPRWGSAIAISLISGILKKGGFPRPRINQREWLGKRYECDERNKSLLMVPPLKTDTSSAGLPGTDKSRRHGKQFPGFD
jgi:hypothetical protein